MLCKKCGAELPDGTEKCIFCGAVLTEEVPEENGDNVQENNTVYDENERKRREQIEKMMAEKKQQLSEIEERRNSKKQKQKRNKIIIICLIAVIIAAGAGVGAYYIKNMIDTKKIEVTATPLPSASPSETPAMSTESPIPTASIAPTGTAAPQSTTAANGNSTSWTATGGNGSSSSSNRGSSSGNKNTSNSTASSGSSSSGGSSSGTSSGTSSSATSNSSSTSNVPSTGISTNSVDAKLSKGGEVIYNSLTGRYLMTFITDNKKYYANVSPGSTTDQINGKYMTITAAPTGETYNGNTVYEISTLTYYSGDGYILKDSGTRLLTDKDIAGLSKDTLALARNEIYARHGRKFKMAVYQDYFNKCSWYSVNPNYNYADDNSNLNSIEAKNVAFILKAENSK